MMRFEKLNFAIIFAAAVLLISISIYTIAYTATPVHYWDQWEMVKHLANGGGATFSYLFAKHNEHIIFTSKLLFFIDYFLFDYSNIMLVWCIVALQFAIAFSIARISIDGNTTSTWLLFVVFGAVMLSLSQWENLTIGFQTQFGLAALFAILACYATQRYVMSASTWNTSLLFVFILTAATMFSMGNGIVIIVSQLIVLIANRTHWRKFLLVCLSYILPLTIFLQGGSGAQTASIFDNLNVFAILKFMMAVIGSSFTSSYSLAALSGVMLFAVFAWLAINYGLVHPLLKNKPDPKAITLISIGAFSVVSAIAVTYGRYPLGEGAALASRYSALNLLLFCCIIGLIYRAIPPTQLRRTAIVCGALGIVIAGVTSLRSLNFIQLETRSNVLRQASYFVLAGARDDRTLKALYPDPAAIRTALDFLRDEKLNIFSSEHGLAVPTTDAVPQSAALPTCNGVSLTGTTRIDQNTWVANGTIDESLDTADSDWVLAVSDTGKIYGFAPPIFQRPGLRGLVWRGQTTFQVPIQMNDKADIESPISIVLLGDNSAGCRLSNKISLPKLYFQTNAPEQRDNLQAEVRTRLDSGFEALPGVLRGNQSLERPQIVSTWQGSDEKTGSVTYSIKPDVDGRCPDVFVSVMRGPTSEGIRLEVGSQAAVSESKRFDELPPHQWGWIKVRDRDSCVANNETVISLIDEGSGWGAWAAITPPVGTYE